MTSKLVRRTAALALFAASVVTASAVHAAVVFYADRASFDAANPGLPIEDFEEANVSAAGILSMPNPLDSATNNGIFSTGDILNGLRIRTPDNDGPSALAIPGAGFAGIVPSKSVFGNFFGTGLDAIFYDGDVFAVGLDLYSYSAGSTRTVNVFGTAGLLDSITLAVSTSGTFVGIQSSDRIAYVNVGGVAGYTIGFDNVAFGAARVPEPGTLALLGISFAGLAATRRRKK